MNFQEKLQKLRKSEGYSQEELASELNVSRQAISKWEQGTIPDISNLLVISKFFDCSLDYLLNDAYEEEPKEKTDEKPPEKQIETIIIDKTRINVWLLVSTVCVVLPLLCFILIYVLSLVKDVRFSRGIIDGPTLHYMGICAFVEKYDLSSVIIFESVVFFAGFISLAIFNYRKKKIHIHSINTNVCRMHNDGSFNSAFSKRITD